MYNFCISLTRLQKRSILLATDLVLVVLAFVLSWAVALGGLPEPSALTHSVKFLVVLLTVGLVLSLVFGVHRIKLNTYELKGILESSVISVALGLAGAGANLLPGAVLPAQAFIVLSMSYGIMSIGYRLILRAFLFWLYRRHESRKRVLVYGAGQTGQQLVAALKTDNEFEPVGFVDDNPTLHQLSISGFRVHSPVRIQDLIGEKEVDRVVLAMPSASQATRARISGKLRNLGCEVHSVPSFAELLVDGKPSKETVPVEVSELLGRSALEGQLPGFNGTYKGRSILITGAGGSIGTELCRQILDSKPKCLVMLDHSELALYNIDRDMRAFSGKTRIVPVLGSICQRPLVESVLEEYEIDVVLHAAAYKHLPLVEENCVEGLRNNVIGTKIVAEAARKAGVERFILVSSDKAVRPTSVLGSSKRLAEMVVQDLSERPEKTLFSMVRFGNVLGSSGSVIPLFQEQIARGGPVTLTHEHVTRYFMTVSEAVSLVLLAGTFVRGGEVFVLDMGKPVPIDVLARQMIRSAGYSVLDDGNPDGDIEIQITGLRDGEKMHEELLIGSDMLTTPHPKILRAQEGRLSEIEMANAMQDLRNAIDAGDEAAARKVLARWVEPHEETAVSLEIVNR